MHILLFALLLSLTPASSAKELEAVSADVAADLVKKWAAEKQKTYLPQDAFIAEIKKNGFADDDPFFSFVYSPVKKGDQTFAKFEYGTASVRSLGPKPRWFKFHRCEDFVAVMSEALPFTTTGAPPYEIRSNFYFALHNGAHLLDGLLENCRFLMSASNFECPENESILYRYLGKLGPLLTYQLNSTTDAACGGKNSYSTTFESIDLRTRKTARITDFFQEEDLLRSLQNDGAVRAFFKGKLPQTLGKIMSEETGMNLKGFGVFESKYRDGRLRIRWVSEIFQCAQCTNYTVLGLDVKPTAEFRKIIEKLDLKKEKFFTEQ